MPRSVVLVAASLCAAPLLAQEQAYIYISYKAASGASFRHKLDCIDSRCKININRDARQISLSAAQSKALLDALQAEARQFSVTSDSASSGILMKIKFRYDTPQQRLMIERRLPADQPAGLTPEMLHIIKAHLNLDLSRPVSAGEASSGTRSTEPAPHEQSQ